MYELKLSSHQDKNSTYTELLPQLRALIESDRDLPIAALGNVCAALKETFNWLWVGFYWVNASQNELQLDVFQGPVACTRIAKGRGVCGQAWQQARIIIVENVNKHPDHIACSSRSQSEIVVPIYDTNGTIIGVLDVDDEHLARFDDTDAQYLQQLCTILSENLFQAA
ncbi:MAG: GAF domain-containing protein [Alysiella sp.]|uniref:GAF domain-containing protein n=1 Tax=Alysiella sp. TaxID=1872483 RepID=UPI0026DCFFA3|nr:GAF domain-containing protein [Alysiella sp.]MDO4433080.1 GAF domain-containing protein [Alysiella sp.]